MPPCDKNRSLFEFEGVIVSILVLMDAALRLNRWSMAGLRNQSFNPCFDGCRPATTTDISQDLRKFSFNPCFDGCRPATIVDSSTVATMLHCFNPCFDGCRPATRGRGEGATKSSRVSILVLMDAALRLLLAHSLLNQNQRFNPCFDGCRPATRVLPYVM